MCLMGASASPLYPAPDLPTSTYYGATTSSSGTVFTGESFAVIRSILISNSTSGNPVLELWNGANQLVQKWTLAPDVAQSIYCGDGYIIPGGFYVKIPTAGVYATIVYDKS